MDVELHKTVSLRFHTDAGISSSKWTNSIESPQSGVPLARWYIIISFLHKSNGVLYTEEKYDMRLVVRRSLDPLVFCSQEIDWISIIRQIRLQTEGGQL